MCYIYRYISTGSTKHIMGKFLCVTLIMFLPFLLHSQINYIKDSIFVNINEDQKPVLLHEIEIGQTLYGLSKFYNIPVEIIQTSNPQLLIQSLSIGQIIKIPFNVSFLSKQKQGTPVFYKVEKSEGLFAIARRKLGLEIEWIKELNGLNDNVVNENQLLLIGYLIMDSKESSATVLTDSISDDTELVVKTEDQNSRNRIIYDAQIEGKKVILEKGVAFWNKESAISKGNYVLHRTAPINSIVEITNPMFGITVLGKVVGNLPPRTYSDEVKIVITPTMARELRAMDSRFFSQIRYTTGD